MLINRNKRDEHKQLLREFENEWAEYHSPSAAAAATPTDTDEEEETSSNNLNPIAPYDNADTAAAAAVTSVTITVKHTDHPMQLLPDVYVCKLPHGSDANSVKNDLLFQHFAARGWTAREMTVTRTGSINNLVELDDDYELTEDMTLVAAIGGTYLIRRRQQ